MIVLTASLCLAFNIQFVSAQGENVIYILGDGSLNPLTAPLIRDGALSENFVGSIIVWTDNIVIDGNGFTLQGSGQGTGFDLNEAHNITIQNMVIKKFSTAFYIRKSSFITIRNNTITENGGFNTPIVHETSFMTSNNTISHNIIKNNTGVAVVLSGTYGNVSGNLITNNLGSGIRLNGINATVFENTIVNNTYAVSISETGNTLFLNNFVNNTNLLYEFGQQLTATWTNGTHGNYWGNYDGTDGNGDGIGDTPFVIDENNLDTLPLVETVNVVSIPEISSWTLILVIFAALGAFLTVYNRRTANKSVTYTSI